MQNEFVAVTSAHILGQHFCSLSTDALNLLLDVFQLCAHATADPFHQAGEVKWQQACSSNLLRIPQPADLHLPYLHDHVVLSHCLVMLASP